MKQKMPLMDQERTNKYLENQRKIALLVSENEALIQDFGIDVKQTRDQKLQGDLQKDIVRTIQNLYRRALNTPITRRAEVFWSSVFDFTCSTYKRQVVHGDSQGMFHDMALAMQMKEEAAMIFREVLEYKKWLDVDEQLKNHLGGL